MKRAIMLLGVLMLGCSSIPIVAMPPPILPGIPGQHWRLCLKLTEAGIADAVTSDPQVSAALTPQQMACLRMRAAAECGFVFQKLAAEDPDPVGGFTLAGEWCPADFIESARRATDTRCGDDPDPLVDTLVDEVTTSMGRRIAAALSRVQSGGKN